MVRRFEIDSCEGQHLESDECEEQHVEIERRESVPIVVVVYDDVDHEGGNENHDAGTRANKLEAYSPTNIHERINIY